MSTRIMNFFELTHEQLFGFLACRRITPRTRRQFDKLLPLNHDHPPAQHIRRIVMDIPGANGLWRFKDQERVPLIIRAFGRALEGVRSSVRRHRCGLGRLRSKSLSPNVAISGENAKNTRVRIQLDVNVEGLVNAMTEYGVCSTLTLITVSERSQVTPSCLSGIFLLGRMAILRIREDVVFPSWKLTKTSKESERGGIDCVRKQVTLICFRVALVQSAVVTGPGLVVAQRSPFWVRRIRSSVLRELRRHFCVDQETPGRSDVLSQPSLLVLDHNSCMCLSPPSFSDMLANANCNRMSSLCDCQFFLTTWTAVRGCKLRYSGRRADFPRPNGR